MRLRCSPSWLWLLVAVQVAIPASYYLVREDEDDERFAWRMFSAIRLKRCDVDAFDALADDAQRPIALAEALHASWQRSLGRGRRPVVARFLATRCSMPEVRYAGLERRCTSPAGRTLPTEHYRYDCAAARLEVTE